MGLSVRQVAEKLKLPDSEITRIEAGGGLTMNRLHQFAELYHRSTTWLFDDSPIVEEKMLWCKEKEI